jgi:hypothetical protein
MYTPLPTVERPWESISMDYMSGLPSTKCRNDFVFVVVDHFSKMEIMADCEKRITTEAIAKIFFERVWVHFGIPHIFFKSAFPSKINAMINMRCHTSFRWELKFGFTCRKNTLQGPIRSFVHYAMELIPSPRLWVTMILSSTFPPSLD